MNSLPNEILERILIYLPLECQISFESVCIRWRQILQSLWTNRSGGIAVAHKWSRVVFYDPCRSMAPNQPIDLLTTKNSDRSASIVRHVLRRYGGEMTLFRLENCRCSAEFLLAVADLMPNMTSLALIGNRVVFRAPSLDFVVSLRPLVCNDRIQQLSLVRNQGLNYRDWTFCRHPPFVPPTILLFVGELNYSSTVTALNLHNVYFVDFVQLCRRLAPNLKRFRLYQDNCNILKENINVGLSALSGLVDLNLAGKNYSYGNSTAYLDDRSLESIGKSMSALETLSLSFAHEITDAGVLTLLKSTAGCRALRRLNLDNCTKITGRSIIEGCRCYRFSAPPLTVYARCTSVARQDALKVRNYTGGDNDVVVDNEKPEDFMFFGDD